MTKLAQFVSARWISAITGGLLWIAAFNNFEEAYLTSLRGRFVFGVVYALFALAAFLRAIPTNVTSDIGDERQDQPFAAGNVHLGQLILYAIGGASIWALVTYLIYPPHREYLDIVTFYFDWTLIFGLGAIGGVMAYLQKLRRSKTPS